MAEVSDDPILYDFRNVKLGVGISIFLTILSVYIDKYLHFSNMPLWKKKIQP